MERWEGRVAVVTGASSGIGEAAARSLAEHGMKVAALARRIDRLKALENEFSKSSKGTIKGFQCDVTKEEDIIKAFENIEKTLGGISILINNAGVYKEAEITEGKTEDFKTIGDTNLLGPSICSREALNSMKKNSINDGHFIFINSICGHVMLNIPKVAYYSATKSGLKTLTAYLRMKLAQEGSKARVTSVSPGLVSTEMTENYPGIEKMPALKSKDISDSLIYAISAPNHVNISELIIQPTGEKMI